MSRGGARYRNEVEHISVYIISLTKRQLDYLLESRHDQERFLLNFPANYKILLKAAAALAEWLLDFDKTAEQNAKGKEECARVK